MRRWLCLALVLAIGWAAADAALARRAKKAKVVDTPAVSVATWGVTVVAVPASGDDSSWALVVVDQSTHKVVFRHVDPTHTGDYGEFRKFGKIKYSRKRGQHELQFFLDGYSPGGRSRETWVLFRSKSTGGFAIGYLAGSELLAP